MKNTTLLFLMLFCFKAYSQIVDIPDANFKTVLLSGTITTDADFNVIELDTNNDGEVQISEALTVFGISIPADSTAMITDVTGIEAFSNLERLWISEHSVTALNVTENTNLRYLGFTDNPISMLDVSNNPSLVSLSVNNSLISTLDLSNNPSLLDLICGYNPLESFNIKNGNSLALIEFNGLNNLQFICADSAEHSMLEQKIINYGYTGVVVDDVCAYLGITEPIANDYLAMYPNPASGTVTFDHLPIGDKLQIVDAIGNVVYESVVTQQKMNVDLAGFRAGVYFVSTQNKQNTQYQKFVLTGN